MRAPPRPYPTEEQSIAISILLLKRARAGEFGYCGDIPLGVWDSAPKFWRIGSRESGYALNCWQAASVALGRAVPAEQKIIFTRFPELSDARSYVGAATADRKPPASARVPRSEVKEPGLRAVTSTGRP